MMKIIDEAYNGKPISVPVIDAHSHILEDSVMGWYQSFTSNSDIIALMDHIGIDCIVTAPHSLIMGNMTYSNEVAADAAHEYPGRIYGYISIIPQEGLAEVKRNLDKYSKNSNFIGLKFLSGYHGTLTSVEYNYAFDFAREIGCPVLSHIWTNNPPMKEVEEVVKSRPSLKLLMAHQGGGTAESTDDYVKLMKVYPNLYMEICGSLYNEYSIEEFVEMVGEDRVIYGSDMINLDPRFDFGRVTFSSLEDGVKKKIFAENYLNLIKGSGMGQIYL